MDKTDLAISPLDIKFNRDKKEAEHLLSFMKKEL